MPILLLRTAAPGAAYFAVVFAVGFALGTVRTLLLAPSLGALLAVLIELPLMLVASWFACAWVLRRWQVPAEVGSRLTMGAVAFALLIIAEIALSLTAFDRSISDYFRELTTTHGLVGLAGQILFALIPLVRLRGPDSPVKGP